LPTAAGFTLTIDAPDTYTPDEPFAVSGRLTVAFDLPIIVEVGEGVPDEEIVIRVDGAPAATAITDDDGSYQVQLTFDSLPPTTRALQAIAFEGELLETRSRTVETRQDRSLVELTVEPAFVAFAPGATEQLLATAMWDDGRTSDVTARANWSTSDAGVATVSADGVVEAVAPGTATITATLREKAVRATVIVE